MMPIYVVHDSASEVILDYAALLGADAVIMGISRRNAFRRRLEGDVVREVARFIPESIPLIIHA